jgi:pyrroline-5-carboxylate reductase
VTAENDVRSRSTNALETITPGVVYYLLEALIEAGVSAGVPRTASAETVTRAAVDATNTLQTTRRDVVWLRQSASPPAGRTAIALRQMDFYRVRAACFTALEQATNVPTTLDRDR